MRCGRAISFRPDTCLEVDPTFDPRSSGSFYKIIAFAVREVVQALSAMGVEREEQAIGIFAGDPGMLLQFSRSTSVQHQWFRVFRFASTDSQESHDFILFKPTPDFKRSWLWYSVEVKVLR